MPVGRRKCCRALPPAWRRLVVLKLADHLERRDAELVDAPRLRQFAAELVVDAEVPRHLLRGPSLVADEVLHGVTHLRPVLAHRSAEPERLPDRHLALAELVGLTDRPRLEVALRFYRVALEVVELEHLLPRGLRRLLACHDLLGRWQAERVRLADVRLEGAELVAKEDGRSHDRPAVDLVAARGGALVHHGGRRCPGRGGADRRAPRGAPRAAA